MLFRDTGSCAHSSVDSEDYSSSGGSLASSESCATRAFESRMKQIFGSGPVLEFEAREGKSQLEDAGLKKKGITQDREGGSYNYSACTGDEQESCLNADDEAYLGILMQGINKIVLLDTEFYPYPTPEYFEMHPPRRGLVDEQTAEGGASSSHHHGTKMFIGGLRFEVVHVGRHMIGWIFEVACGVRLPSSSILVHRKAKGGRSGSPTGCVSVFVSSEGEVELLLAMNQRLFCAEKGVYVASSAEHMRELIASKAILDVTEGRARGPTHPVVIERAYGNAGHHATRSGASTSQQQERVAPCPPSPYDLVPLGTPSGTTSLPSCSNASSVRSSVSAPLGPKPVTGGDGDQAGKTRLLTPSKDPIYHLYPGSGGVSKLLLSTSATLQRAVSIFVGGFSAETDQEFVAWVFSLMSVPVHPSNVSHYVDSQSGAKAGCVLVRVEEQDVSKVLSWNRRVVCDARGVYFTSSQRAVVALLAARDKAAGPARPLAIRRKDGGRGVPKATVPGSMAPPPPFPVMWDPAQSTPAAWKQTSSPLVAPPPPPYMQSVIIGNQTYQLPPGASIQLQVVPVITAPNISSAPVPLQSPALPMYQPMPPPPPPPLR
ncbi:hypothetical protein TRSC58_00303 [Trypanosoma rangeli SC58]|uniref:Uncharacterized protein n=1 Tax=Trypanosoma rangeli SC58 TaxID=429131 RepID=A0A061J927_TRYRA|nr:hypothetical protein TRSC58_00303 [Trypanosoma rangeli SC58]